MLAQDYDLYRDGENAAIKAYDISEAERDGTLEYTASVYDFMNDQITYDFSVKGPRIVDFSKILQYDYFPLAPTLQILLNIFSQAMGSPVEIEFSVINFESGTLIFYLLQIKPLIKNEYNIDIDDLSIDPTHVLLKADKGMGNGKLQYIRDVVYVDPDKFDRLRTEEIAEESNVITRRSPGKAISTCSSDRDAGVHATRSPGYPCNGQTSPMPKSSWSKDFPTSRWMPPSARTSSITSPP